MDQLIIKFLEKTASEEEKTALLTWIHESPENKQYFLECRDLWINTGVTLAEKFDGTEAFSKFRKTALNYEKSKREKTSGIKYLKYAASIIILIGCSFGMYLLGSKKAGNGNTETIINQMVTTENKTNITLPDGTVVSLNNNSKLSYPAQFEEKKRLVKLEGEAFFEVKHNESVPFFVETDGMIVKVLGTEFDVRSYPEEAYVETILLSGKVEVNLVRNNDIVKLSPHQKVFIDKQTGNHHIETVDASEYTLWKNDRLIMNNEELGTILRKIERWYNVEISYSNNLPLKSKFSITITDEPKEEIFRLLSIVASIKYKIDNEKITITRK